MFNPTDYFDLAGCEYADLFAGVRYVWQALERLEEYIDERLVPEILGRVAPGAFVSDRVWLGPGAVVEPGAVIKGPAIIGAGTVVRHGAYIRESCLIGRDCVVGHATEIKRSVMLDGSQAPHFNYVGDSILGRRTNLGAGTRCANMKNDHSTVVVRASGRAVDTGLSKLGAVLGDDVQTGCNVVTSPGTLVGPGCRVYAGAVLRGVYPPRTLVKVRQILEAVSLAESDPT
ncbi:MAG: hypothetical protein GX161_01410 [Firmicutes bacterium]|jgi:NDP-sugar pyrophosphorylase family protein|nr:hypothetical protein [Bacillota bacterium]